MSLKRELEFAAAAKGRHFRATAPIHVDPKSYPDAVTMKTNNGGRRGPQQVFAFLHEHERSTFLARNPGARVL